LYLLYNNIAYSILFVKHFFKNFAFFFYSNPPAGIPPDILAIARKIALLPPEDREELLAIVELKLAKLRRAEE
jgi:hypothetical protein